MMDLLVSRNFRNFSLEIEKHRKGIEELFDFPALLIFSRSYVRDVHVGGVKDFFEDFLYNAEFTNEKVSVAMLCFGIFMIALGFRKYEAKR